MSERDQMLVTYATLFTLKASPDIALQTLRDDFVAQLGEDAAREVETLVAIVKEGNQP